ncbi:MAG TPA: type II toxin-antitoxin system RelE/ParE family toxin [Pelobium sp.]|nr:type II toxin-antitoxin system RelE/ParE family toxin [Pelobium sp.]
MAKKTVVWTVTAIRQRRNILEYWVQHNSSTQYSKKLVKAINLRVGIIAKHPEVGKQTSMSETRESAMGNFSLYYKIIEDKIVIMAFWDNRQNPDEVLKLLESNRV